MPNWCSNQLSIKTTVDPEEFLVREWDDYYLMFNKLVDIWEWDYDEAIRKWWTKWDIASIDNWKIITDWNAVNRIFVDNRSTWYWIYEVFFDTAWWPPIQYLETLYEYLLDKDKLSTVTCKYFEPWMWMMWQFINGIDSESLWNMEYIEELEWYVTSDHEAFELCRDFDTIMMTDVALEEIEELYNNWIIKRWRYKELISLLN